MSPKQGIPATNPIQYHGIRAESFPEFQTILYVSGRQRAVADWLEHRIVKMFREIQFSLEGIVVAYQTWYVADSLRSAATSRAENRIRAVAAKVMRQSRDEHECEQENKVVAN